MDLLKQYRRIISATMIAVVSVAPGIGCSPEDSSDDLFLGALLLSSQGDGATATTSSSDDLVSIPDVLTASSSTASAKESAGPAASDSGRSAKALPQGTAAQMGGLFEPVRSSIAQGASLVELAGLYMDFADSLAVQFPGAVGEPIRFTGEDDSSTAEDETADMILSLANSSTFAEGGRKMVVWRGEVGADDEDFVKILELDYTRTGETTDGVIFLQLPTEGLTDSSDTVHPLLIRIEFQKKANGEKRAVVHGQGFQDWSESDHPGSAAYYLQQTADGDVIIDGGYTVASPKMPFLDQNLDNVTNLGDNSPANNLCDGSDCFGWGTNDIRVYTFSATGSEGDGLGVAHLLLPRNSETPSSGTNGAFVDDAAVTPGKLYTETFLAYFTWRTETDDYKTESDHNLSYLWENDTDTTPAERTYAEGLFGTVDNDLDFLNLMAEYLFALHNEDDLFSLSGVSGSGYSAITGCNTDLQGASSTADGDGRYVTDLAFVAFGDAGNSTQEDLADVLNLIEACTVPYDDNDTPDDTSDDTGDNLSWLFWLRVVAGAKNPVYFMQYEDSDGTTQNEIVGQEDTTGLDTLTLTDGSTTPIDVDRLAALAAEAPMDIRGADEDGGVFTPEGITGFFVAPSADGVTQSCDDENFIKPLEDHSSLTAIHCWVDLFESVPSYTDLTQ